MSFFHEQTSIEYEPKFKYHTLFYNEFGYNKLGNIKEKFQ